MTPLDRPPVYDANGNVHGLLNSSGTLVAAYAYSAFGEVLSMHNPQGGAHAQANPFRFASKWQDAETGLYQYNHRYYSPTQGRFISRDPIAENGGLNLYAYCGNDPVDNWDYLGMSWLSKAFKKIGRWVKNNWRSIVGVVLNFIPYVGPYLSAAWNAGVGYKYGGTRGLITSLAGSGYLGGTMRYAAQADGLYRGFRSGKFLNNLSNYMGSHAMSSTIGSIASGRTPQWTDTFSSIGSQWRGLRVGAMGAASRLGVIAERQGATVGWGDLQVVDDDYYGQGRYEAWKQGLERGTGSGTDYYSWSRPETPRLHEISGYVAPGQGTGGWMAAYRAGAWREGRNALYAVGVGIAAPPAIVYGTPWIVQGGTAIGGAGRTIFSATKISLQVVGRELPEFYHTLNIATYELTALTIGPARAAALSGYTLKAATNVGMRPGNRVLAESAMEQLERQFE